MTRWSGWVGCVFFCLGLIFGEVRCKAQDGEGTTYGSRNTFAGVVEYSNDSSHIVLGEADNIKLGGLGVQYQRRLLAGRGVVFSYAMEFRPVMLESNPTETFTSVQTFPYYSKYVDPNELTTKCVASAVPYHVKQRDPPVTYAGVDFTTCGRQANYALGFAPFGLRLNFRRRSRVQPTVSSFEEMILSTKPLPVATAGSFNFAFEIGAGVEYYRTERTSVRLEYQVQHYSNAFTAGSNPGVDNGILKLTYSFGR